MGSACACSCPFSMARPDDVVHITIVVVVIAAVVVVIVVLQFILVLLGGPKQVISCVL